MTTPEQSDEFEQFVSKSSYVSLKVRTCYFYFTVYTDIYPTIAAIFDRNRPDVYIIAIYDRLYTAE